MNKRLGILIPVSALPSDSGIGEFGKSCFKLLDFMSKNHYHYWQILPLNPLGYGYSPYMSSCSKAIEYRYIALDDLYREGLLSKLPPRFRVTASKINYKQVGVFKRKYLKEAFLNYKKGNMEGLKKFKFRQPWVQKYATFEAFKEKNNYKVWNEWPEEEISYFDNHTTPPRSLLDRIDYFIFEQYLAYRQWRKVVAYANTKDIKIIADMPFYVGYDSVEVWLNKKCFLLDEKTYLPKLVAGVPPDAFSDVGQLWGNPIYNFKYLKEHHYDLLVDRLGFLSEQCEYLRLDHFRAFDTYYTIKYGELTAKIGKWEKGPGMAFFDEFYKKYPNAKLIAEDLGELFPSVIALRKKLKLPGMYVSQFHLLDKMDTSELVVYSGTHDNQTLEGFTLSLSNDRKKQMAKVCKCRKTLLFKGIMEYILNLPSFLTIVAMQDLLRLNDKARMNTPSTCGDPNFTWKMKSFIMLKNIKIQNKGKHYYVQR